MATASTPGDDLFTALAHPLRRRILRKLIAEGRALSPAELSESLDEPLSKLSYHVRVLANCDAVKLVRTRQIRGSTQHFYRVTVKTAWARAALQAKEKPPRRGRRGGS
jgi:DNA-binding transcriptional ArsR family regulator